jgi:hypothetical protein
MDDVERAALVKEFAAFLDLVEVATSHITPEYVEARLQETLRAVEAGTDP